MRALVTGGAGFIGSPLVSALLSRGAEVLVIDDLSVGTVLPEDQPRAQVRVASINDTAARQAILDFAPDTVFHLAALHFIPWCERNPDAAYRANVDGTRRLLDVLDRVRPLRLLFATSVAVYGFCEDRVIESMPRKPNGVYANTKVVGEDLVRDYARWHPECTVTMPRLANVYGPGDPNEHLIPMLCRDLGGEIRVGNLWPQRDYVHVSDVVSAMLCVSQLPAGLHTYNVGTGVGTTVDTIVQTLAGLSGVPMTLISEPERQRADDGHLVADPTALQRATGWRPRTDLRTGLAGVLESVPAAAGR